MMISMSPDSLISPYIEKCWIHWSERSGFLSSNNLLMLPVFCLFVCLPKLLYILAPPLPLQNSASELRGCFLGLSLQYVHQRKQNGQLLGCALFSINTLCLEPRHFFSSLLLRKLSIVSHIPDLLYSCYYFITLDICFILHGCLLTVILLGKRILFYFLASKNSSQI